jgi:hypothetical protein
MKKSTYHTRPLEIFGVVVSRGARGFKELCHDEGYGSAVVLPRRAA